MKMNNTELVNNTIEFVKEKLSFESTGHDWWHAYRVWKNTRVILQNEIADNIVAELAALLHDIADHKFYDADHTIGARVANDHLMKLGMQKNKVHHICKIIESVSFSTGTVPRTVEGKIVQDADRLDAMGAIGIARAFAYGGFKGREMYNPDIKPRVFANPGEYLKSDSPTINHFYEKLLLLKDRMNTKTGQKLAEERHKYMLKYLEHFFNEWDGK